MPKFSSTLIRLFEKRVAPEQGGLLSGKDPTAYNPTDPIRLWIIQLGIIVCTACLLSLALQKLRQPKVIAEVLGGILLGPTAFGRIPGFTEHVFPKESIPFLNLTANIGLCLFLFLVGLEIDAGVIKRNARLSATIALSGMILPFAIGSGLSVRLYSEFISSGVKFTHFMLFTGVAYSITAFPVLCRILTEVKLLDTTVGVVVLSAGVGNDIVGWTLLALSVALVNAGSGLTAVYILLACIGWALFMLFPVKMAIRLLAKKTGSIESGPTVFFMTVTMMVVFSSAFFTDVIGVHAIFGAFLAGLIVPREGGLAITMTEKLEDMVAIIFLPLYFTLSGLSTDLGLLNNGVTWGYTIAIITTAFTGKFGGCLIAARFFAGFNWREAGAIGSLMSCKGLVELIVLNVGLSAGILSQRVFSMFVLEALVLTFMTTPLVTWLYPPQHRTRVALTGPNFRSVVDDEGAHHDKRPQNEDRTSRIRFTVVLDKLEHVPGMMALTQLIRSTPPSLEGVTPASDHKRRRSGSSSAFPVPHTSVEALRLIELSDRVSAVMKSSVTETLIHTDPLLSIFKMFGQLNHITITPCMSIVKYEDMSYNVAERARDFGSDMILLPWLPPTRDNSESTIYPHVPLPSETPKAASSNPFDMLFKTTTGLDASASAIHSHFIRGVFSQASTDVALYVDQTVLGSPGSSPQHIFLPFFGGPDDRLALEFVAQLCENPRVIATVVRIVKRDVEAPIARVTSARLGAEKTAEEMNALTVASAITGFPDTVYGQANTEMRIQSETADNVAWAQYASPASDTRSTISSSVLQRIEFREVASPVPLHVAIREANSIFELSGSYPLIVTGRSRRLAVENHRLELKELMDEYQNVGTEVKKTIGDVATAFLVAGCGAGVVVLQAMLAHEGT